jgi:predicted transglutaminase-like cysteine proteinase
MFLFDTGARHCLKPLFWGEILQRSKLIRVIVGSLSVAGYLALATGTAGAADPLAPIESAPIVVTGKMQAVPPNVLGTATLPIRPDRYAIEWARASQDASNVPALRQLVEPARRLGRAEQIAFVQAVVAQRIRWRSDATEWGRHDYWASARETLAHGAGDQEDRAVLKMQALRALGFPTRDLYLTIGKETIGGPPITVLLVRFNNRYFVLDDWSGPPIPVERRTNFVPMLSFAQGGSWIHGKRAGARGVASVATGAGTSSVSR